MIYQPRNVQPSYKSIDGNNNNKISMTMNTTNYVESYKLTIYNMDNTIFYEGDKTDFSDKLYNGDTGFIDLPSSLGLVNGNDYKWTVRLYQSEVNMAITYGTLKENNIYTYVPDEYGLENNNYYYSLNDTNYLFTTTYSLTQNDILIFNASNETITLYRGLDENILMTTSLKPGNFANLPVSKSGNSYIYTVGGEGLSAGDYYITVEGVDYWFTTLSDLTTSDSIEFNSDTNKITQTHIQSAGNIVLTLQYVCGKKIDFNKVVNTKNLVSISKNINIKPGMYLSINNELHMIAEYNMITGTVSLEDDFSFMPEVGLNYYIYSDFIETNPEGLLYVRETPTLSIIGGEETLTSKTASFTGVYQQNNGVPLVYFLWSLYSVDSKGATLVKTSGKVYNANVTFSYDGFKNGETYSLTLLCENEFGIETQTSVLFNVDYEELVYDEKPVAEQTNEEGVRVSWLTTISTEPYSTYTKNAVGYIQSPENTSTSIWLEKNQSIYPDTIIVVGISEISSVIQSYDANTGLAVLKIPLTHIPEIGDYYYIFSQPDYDLTGIEIKTDTPYTGVNTASLGDNYLVYEKESGLSLWPTDFQLSTQFKLAPNFFYGNDGVYQNTAIIARYEGDDEDGLEEILFVAHGYDFALLTPASQDGVLASGTVTSASTGGMSIQISGLNIDVNNQKYIYLVEQEELAYISDYDRSTNTITFDRPLFQENIPSIGDHVYLYNTVESPYYDTPNHVFCLQTNNKASNYSDYIWADDAQWNDTLYWIEGGTPIGRATDNWWKVSVTKDKMDVSKGGV